MDHRDGDGDGDGDARPLSNLLAVRRLLLGILGLFIETKTESL
jgi:hypothetical protein